MVSYICYATESSWKDNKIIQIPGKRLNVKTIFLDAEIQIWKYWTVRYIYIYLHNELFPFENFDCFNNQSAAGVVVRVWLAFRVLEILNITVVVIPTKLLSKQ